MIPARILVNDLQPGDVILWDSQRCLVESVDKSFYAAIKIKLHNFYLEKHWPPTQQVLRFAGLPVESEHPTERKEMEPR